MLIKRSCFKIMIQEIKLNRFGWHGKEIMSLQNTARIRMTDKP